MGLTLFRGADAAAVEVVEVHDGLGVSHARNEGIRRETGDWLVFIAGDDLVDPAFFSEVVRLSDSADLLVFRIARFWDDAGLSKAVKLRPFPGLWSACAFRRDGLPKDGFEPFSFGEDKIFLLQCLLRAKRVGDVNRIVYGYRQYADSTVWRKPTLGRFLDRRDYARQWLALSRELSLDGPFVTRQMMSLARREIARDTLGSLSIELFKIAPRPWREWLEGLDCLVEQTDLLPTVARLQLWLCRTWRWLWVTRLVVEWPHRIRDKIKRTFSA